MELIFENIKKNNPQLFVNCYNEDKKEVILVEEPNNCINDNKDKVILVEEPNKCIKKNYIKKFIEKNKERIKEKTECPICYSTYTYFNKSKHIKTKRHLKCLEKLNNK